MLSKVDEIQILEHMARQQIEHMDNCGVCERLKISAEEAKIELAKDEVSYEATMERIENRWRRSKYWVFLRELLDAGKSVDEIEEEFEKKGWEM